MANQITFEDGIIYLDEVAVPGIMRSLSVDGKVRFDEQKVDGASGKKKTPQGYEDCDISVSLYLCTDDESSCYAKLAMLSEMFRSVDDGANPKIYEIFSMHLFLRGIRKVVFSKLTTAENDKSDEITATLGFVEHNPPIVKTEKEKANTPTPGELAQRAAEQVVGGEKGRDNNSNKPVEDSVIIELG